MSNKAEDDLFARLARGKQTGGEANPWSAINTTEPAYDDPPVVSPESIAQEAATDEHEILDEDDLAPLAESQAVQHQSSPATSNPARADSPAGDDPVLESLLGRLNNLVGEKSGSALHSAAAKADLVPDSGFVPEEPNTLREAGLVESDVEALSLKALYSRGMATGRELADQVKLPFKLVEQVLFQAKSDQLVVYRGSAPMNDYEYAITDTGRERARRLNMQCTYFGAAPVTLKAYIASIEAQSIATQHPTTKDLERAFEDLLLNKRMLSRLGPAINSGRGLFLYGAPGNGKTSIAERVTRSFGSSIWIPRAIGIDGEIIRIFDPSMHEELPIPEGSGLLVQHKIDRRWVRIRRPTIIVGGELTMASLEIQRNEASGINEAPLQMKSNCGTLVIDDFGRQRMSTEELLNRWIVPLEKRYDFLNLANGKKIQVPFDQLIVFSTNLEPKDLVDDAFLRRIPYKIDVVDPSEEEFRELFKIMCKSLKIEYRQEPIDYLISEHYQKVNRPFRCCQPRDLLLQIRNFCLYNDLPTELSNEYFDFAVDNYFAVM